MNTLEAHDTINSWIRILIQGAPSGIDRMLESVEQKLIARGWQRNQDRDARFGNSRQGSDQALCFVSGPSIAPKLTLGLARISSHRVRGEMYSFSNPGASIEIAKIVEDVIANVVTTSATDQQLRVTIPRLGPLSIVPHRTMSTLKQFTNLASGAWPLQADMESVWKRFVITACREDAAFDIDEFIDWFVTCGWTSDDARQLKDKFFRDVALVEEYNEDR